jgi:hypothetical protein
VGTLLNKIKSRTKAVTSKVDKAQEAITFAEAGHPQREETTQVPEPVVSRKLLVVGHESTFSQTVMDYALEMAQRMSYEIIALNTAPLSCNAFKPFAASQKKICQEFQKMSVEQAQNFKQAADKNGVPFTHVVKFNEPDQALEMMKHEHKDIEFIISDEQPEAVPDHVTDTDRPSRQVYVYAMI